MATILDIGTEQFYQFWISIMFQCLYNAPMRTGFYQSCRSAISAKIHGEVYPVLGIRNHRQTCGKPILMFPKWRLHIAEKKKTRAGVCKTLCPQLPDSNTAWLQHCLPMTVTTVFQCYFIKREITLKWEIIKIWVTYFFMRNPYMKFQTSMHSSKLMLCNKKCAM